VLWGSQPAPFVVDVDGEMNPYRRQDAGISGVKAEHSLHAIGFMVWFLPEISNCGW